MRGTENQPADRESERERDEMVFKNEISSRMVRAECLRTALRMSEGDAHTRQKRPELVCENSNKIAAQIDETMRPIKRPKRIRGPGDVSHVFSNIHTLF